MILDSINNASLYTSLHPLFSKAFEYMKTRDLQTLEPGKYAIDDENLFVIVMEYDTKHVSECVMENHKKYIDIQYMVRGEELMGTTLYNGQVPADPYDETRDAGFYKNEYSSLIKVSAGQFAVFFPADLHMPCIKSNEPAKVKKAVFKVKVT